MHKNCASAAPVHVVVRRRPAAMTYSLLWEIAIYLFSVKHSFKAYLISFHLKAYPVGSKPRFIISLVALHLLDLPAFAQPPHFRSLFKCELLYRLSRLLREFGQISQKPLFINDLQSAFSNVW